MMHAKERKTKNAADDDSQEAPKSRYKRVTWNKKNRRWQVSLTVDRKYRYIGSFLNEDVAGRVGDIAILYLRGVTDRLNFAWEDYEAFCRDGKLDLDACTKHVVHPLRYRAPDDYNTVIKWIDAQSSSVGRGGSGSDGGGGGRAGRSSAARKAYDTVHEPFASNVDVAGEDDEQAAGRGGSFAARLRFPRGPAARAPAYVYEHGGDGIDVSAAVFEVRQQHNDHDHDHEGEAAAFAAFVWDGLGVVDVGEYATAQDACTAARSYMHLAGRLEQEMPMVIQRASSSAAGNFLSHAPRNEAFDAAFDAVHAQQVDSYAPSSPHADATAHCAAPSVDDAYAAAQEVVASYDYTPHYDDHESYDPDLFDIVSKLFSAPTTMEEVEAEY